MSIMGITSTMPSMEQQFAMAGPQQAQQQSQQVQQAEQAQQAQQQTQQIQQVQPNTEQAQNNVLDTTIVTMDAPVNLMDTTNYVPEQQDPVADQQVQAEGAAMTGIGQTLNLSF